MAVQSNDKKICRDFARGDWRYNAKNGIILVECEDMYRLTGFDYSSPYYYMVTLKKRDDVAPFSSITEGRLVENEITRSFDATIKNFHRDWLALEPIWCFVVMPDHIHLLLKLSEEGKKIYLGSLVYQLMKALALAYAEVKGNSDGADMGKADCAAFSETGARGSRSLAAREASLSCDARRSPGVKPRLAPIFERAWHDWIVKRDGQLANFIDYIRENPARYWQRRQNRDFFRVYSGVRFLSREWFAYGNLELLKLPVLAALRCSRSIVEGSAEWNAWLAKGRRLGPGSAAVGTILSPCEKATRDEILSVGGNLIVLEPQSYAERGHPPREYEKLCAEGRALFLSLWPAETKKLDRATMYKRCHELGDIAVEGLA